MNTELTTEQIVRIFSQYLGCQTLKRGDHKGVCNAMTLLFIESPDEDYKLLLRPLSAITDEDAADFIRVRGTINWNGPKDAHDVRRFVVAAIGPPVEQGFGFHWEVYQFLIQRGYAVPLFIAPGHPLNGKTAIEIGLAIDSTK